jgi:hypothetical protein
MAVRASWAAVTMNWGLGEAWKERQLGGSWRKSLESLAGEEEGRSGVELNKRAIAPFEAQLSGVACRLD